MLCLHAAASLSQAALRAALLLFAGALVSGATLCRIPIPVEPAAGRGHHRKHQAVPCHAQPEGQQIQEAGDECVHEDIADMERQGVQVSVAVVMQAVDFLPANPCDQARVTRRSCKPSDRNPAVLSMLQHILVPCACDKKACKVGLRLRI
jgi:hypothetical protein